MQREGGPRVVRGAATHLHAAGRSRRRDRELRPVKLRLVAVRSWIVLSESNQFVRPVPDLPPPLMRAAISAASRQRCFRGSNAVSWRCARRGPCERAAHRIGAARKSQFLFARPAPKIVERQTASGGDEFKIVDRSMKAQIAVHGRRSLRSVPTGHRVG